jgi:hypothetical protein
MNTNAPDYQAQAAVVIAELIKTGRIDDALFARQHDDYGGLTYYIARALGLGWTATVKFGLIWAVIDALDSYIA